MMDESLIGHPPPPVIKLTIEQQFKLRRLDDELPMTDKKDLITALQALQHQNFVLHNTVVNLLKQWPIHPLTTQEAASNAGTSLETSN